jgi:hypothetical protein
MDVSVRDHDYRSSLVRDHDYRSSVEILNAYHNFCQNSNFQIFKIVKGRPGFDLARNMLNWEETVCDEEWTSKWSEEEKEQCLFLIYKKKIRTRYKIAIKLLIGSGNTFAGVGEHHYEKKARRIWREWLTI